MFLWVIVRKKRFDFLDNVILEARLMLQNRMKLNFNRRNSNKMSIFSPLIVAINVAGLTMDFRTAPLAGR